MRISRSHMTDRPAPIGPSPVLAFVIALALFAAPPPAAASQPQEPALYRQARDALAKADTLAALASLRQLTSEAPDFAAGWGLLGEVLAQKSSGVATDFGERREADAALRTALRLDSDNPLYLMALGQLMRKQEMYLDARRILERAMDAMEKNPGELPPAERSELWYQRGLFYEDEYLDVRHQVFVSDLPVSTPDCATLGTFCMNFTRPKDFNQHFRNAASLSNFGEDDFERMADAFRKALEADPTNPGAFRRLAIHLVDRGQYDEAEQLTKDYIQHVPDSPWGHLLLGLIYHRTDRDSVAEVEFDEGLKYAPQSVARHYRDIGPLLREKEAEAYEGTNGAVREQLEDVLWRKSDPLYLTSDNEVRVEHLARVTYADVMFEDPSSGVWGAETERGEIYVRYGPPQRIWAVPRDTRKEMSAQNFATRQTSGGNTGGRWIFWNYGWDLPNFIFSKFLRQRSVKHVISASSKSLAEDAREVEPAAYSTNFEMMDHPVQVARFRGAADTVVDVDLYAEVPGSQLLDAPDSLDIGFFLFAGTDYEEVYQRKLTVPSPPKDQAVTFSVPLPPGNYDFSLEAKANTDKAAVHRGKIKAVPYPRDRVSLSDLVIADAVTPKIDHPRQRRDFALKVNRRLQFQPGDPVALYWEVYGAQTDSDSVAHYNVTVQVTDVKGGGVITKLVGAVGQALGLSGGQGLKLNYEREVQPADGRVPEYMTLGLQTQDPGTYRVRIEVTDEISGQTAIAERRFRILGS